MRVIHSFTYEDNFSIFGPLGASEPDVSTCQLASQFEDATTIFREAIGLESNELCMFLAGKQDLLQFIASFVCLVFPPHSPLVIHSDEHETSALRCMIHDFSRGLLSLLCKVEDPYFATSFGIYDSKFMVNLINLYWRNSENAISNIVAFCTTLNRNFMLDLRYLRKPLLEIIEKEVEHLQFLLEGIKQGRTYEAPHTFIGNNDVADRSGTFTAFNRNMLYVEKDTAMLDSVALLETIMQFISEEFYDEVLSTEVSTAEGGQSLVTVISNVYYLSAHCHHYTISQNQALYKMENIPKQYEMAFQRCLFYRCKIVSLNILMQTVKYNVHLNRSGSADFCYNWLLVFTQMGGEDYVFDRDDIINDLREVGFSFHVDSWSNIAGTWLPAEIEQLRNLVPEVEDHMPTDADGDITKIKEITGIEDDALIQRCLKEHNGDVSNAIIDLINRPSTMTAPVVPTQRKKPSLKAYDPYLQPMPKESKQAVINYWDYINTAGIYDDDYDDFDEVDEDIAPLNTKMAYNELVEQFQPDDPEGIPNADSSERQTNREDTSRKGTTSHSHNGEERKEASTRTSRDAGRSSDSRGDRGRRRNSARGRGSRGRRPYNRRGDAELWNEGH